MSQTIHLNELFRSVPQISCKPSHLIWFSEHKRHGEYCKFYHKNARHKHTKDDEFSFILKRVYCPDDRILALRNNNLKNTFSKFRAEQQKKNKTWEKQSEHNPTNGTRLPHYWGGTWLHIQHNIQTRCQLYQNKRFERFFHKGFNYFQLK